MIEPPCVQAGLIEPPCVQVVLVLDLMDPPYVQAGLIEPPCVQVVLMLDLMDYHLHAARGSVLQSISIQENAQQRQVLNHDSC